MNNNPLVTIIVVSYKHSQYIRENLDSIKAQTYNNIQLIVADDASPDHSTAVMDAWLEEHQYPAEKNYHTVNTGLATVLNECIALAKGQYVKMIAADDFLHPEAIEKCVQHLENLGEDYGMVFTDTFAVDDASQIIQDIADYNTLGNVEPSYFKKELLKGNRIAALTVLIRYRVLKETGAYDNRFIVEDYYRWLKISEQYLIAYIPEKLAYYRQHDNNISKRKANRIEVEDLMLKLMFDKTGIAKDVINNKVYIIYMNHTQFGAELRQLYNHYPFRIKRLNIAIKYHLPVSLFRFISRFI